MVSRRLDRNLWRGIWGIKHNEEANWINGGETKLWKYASEQTAISAKTKMSRKEGNKLSNWKSPGPDGVQGYWTKNIKSLHVRILAMLN